MCITAVLGTVSSALQKVPVSLAPLKGRVGEAAMSASSDTFHGFPRSAVFQVFYMNWVVPLLILYLSIKFKMFTASKMYFST